MHRGAAQVGESRDSAMLWAIDLPVVTRKESIADDFQKPESLLLGHVTEGVYQTARDHVGVRELT